MQTHKESRNREVEQAMREASELPQPSIVDIDPEDPSNLLDDAGQFSVVPLGVEVQPSEEGEADLEAAGWEVASEEEEIDEDSEIDEENAELDTPDMTTADAYANAAGD